MKEEAAKKEKIEQLSKEELELDLQRKREVIERTEKLLTFSTDRYKDIHRSMMVAEVLKERDMALELSREKKRLEKIKDEQQDLEYLDRIRQQKYK